MTAPKLRPAAAAGFALIKSAIGAVDVELPVQDLEERGRPGRPRELTPMTAAVDQLLTAAAGGQERDRVRRRRRRDEILRLQELEGQLAAILATIAPNAWRDARRVLERTIARAIREARQGVEAPRS